MTVTNSEIRMFQGVPTMCVVLQGRNLNKYYHNWLLSLLEELNLNLIEEMGEALKYREYYIQGERANLSFLLFLLDKREDTTKELYNCLNSVDKNVFYGRVSKRGEL